MTMRPEPDFAMAYGGIISMRSRLRIAIPSFRLVARREEPRAPEPQGLSREELMTLFQGELCLPRARKLTDAETRDQALACAFRRALYPDAVK